MSMEPTEVKEVEMSDLTAERIEGTELDVLFDIIDNCEEEALDLVEPLDGESIEAFDLAVENAWVTTDAGRDIRVCDIRKTEIVNAVRALSDASGIHCAVGNRDEVIVQYWEE